jgi:hypothetical protein
MRGILILILICAVILSELMSAETLMLNYPEKVMVGEPFIFNITLIDFSYGVYDVKTEIYNNTLDSDNRLSQVYNNGIWKSTYYYIEETINTSICNSSTFLLNITKEFNGLANISISIRKNTGTIKSFMNYTIRIEAKEIIPLCNQNWSCTSWSSCSSQTQTRICSDINKCGNNTGKPAESQACAEEINPNLQVNWEEEEIINGEEFEIEVRAFNLKAKNYDLRVWIEFEDNTTCISERYGKYNDEDIWRSGKYYAESFFSGSGNRSDNIKIRIFEEYKNFEDNAIIKAKLRESDSDLIINEISEHIIILKKEIILVNLSQITPQAQNSAQNNQVQSKKIGSESIIILGRTENNVKDSIKLENSIIYKSKNELIKEYLPYAISVICIFLMVLFAIEKNRKKKK